MPQSLVPASLPSSLRFPRLALARVLPRRQWPLLASKSLPPWAAATAMYLDRVRPDALLAILTPAVVAATLASCMAHHRARIVATQHNVFKSTRDYRRACLSYPHADAAVTVSRGVAGELGRLPGMSHSRIHTIYNPVVSSDVFHKACEPIDHPWLNGRGVPVVLAIGRLHKQKDFPTLLAAFALVLRQRRARLIVLGRGPLLANLRSLAHELRIAKYVEFPGFVENPYAYLARASLFVLSSRHEGLANVLVEAMACGCPVVSTNCRFGPDEILEGGRWGELVPIGNPEALASAIGRTLDNPPQRHGLRDRGIVLQRREGGRSLRGASFPSMTWHPRLVTMVLEPNVKVAGAVVARVCGIASAEPLYNAPVIALSMLGAIRLVSRRTRLGVPRIDSSVSPFFAYGCPCSPPCRTP